MERLEDYIAFDLEFNQHEGQTHSSRVLREQMPNKRAVFLCFQTKRVQMQIQFF